MSYLFDLTVAKNSTPSFFEFALYMVFFPVVICRTDLPHARDASAISLRANQSPANDIGRGFSRIATGVLMMQLAQLLGQGILAGDGINSGFDRVTRWSGTGRLVSGLDTDCSSSWISPGTRTSPSARLKRSDSRCPKTSLVLFNPPVRRSSGRAGTCRCRSGFATMFSFRWRSCAAKCGGEISLLVISMILFGLWHKASVLFVLWGCYHGVLLVLHRQVQQVQRKFDWTPPAAIWAPISWIATSASSAWDGYSSAPNRWLRRGRCSRLSCRPQAILPLSQRKSVSPGGGSGAGIRDCAADDRGTRSLLG